MRATYNYEVVIALNIPDFATNEETVKVSDCDPEQALEAGLRIFIRNYILEVHNVIHRPEKYQAGFDEAVAGITGVKVYERFYPGATIGLATKLVLDFDASIAGIKAKEAFSQAA